MAVVDLMTGMAMPPAPCWRPWCSVGARGRASTLDIALLDVAVAMNANQASNYLVSGESPSAAATTHPNLAPYGVCLRRRLHDPGHWQRQPVRGVLRVNAQDWHLAPEFATNAGRLTHIRQVQARCKEQLAAWQIAELGQALDAHGISWGNINDLEQVFEHPQVRHRQMLQTVQHPQLGP